MIEMERPWASSASIGSPARGWVSAFPRGPGVSAPHVLSLWSLAACGTSHLTPGRDSRGQLFMCWGEAGLVCGMGPGHSDRTQN